MSEQQFSVQRIFLKDVSFETPSGVRAFAQNFNPNINVDLSTRNQKLDNDFIQVDLRVTTTAKHEEQVLYIIEVEYSGIFLCKNISEENMKQLLSVACPTILFPYLRETIDSIVIKANFPALMLAPINFDALFKDAMEIENTKQAH